MSLIQTQAPTVEPIDIDTLKRHLRLSTATTVEEVNLNNYIKVARKQAENYTHRQLCYAKWQMSLTVFPSSRIKLPRSPILAIDGGTIADSVVITYTDSSYAAQTLGATAYDVDVSGTIPMIYPSNNSSNLNAWTDVTLADIPNAIKITWNAGYTTVAPTTALSDVPPSEFQQYIKIRAGSMYRYRETITVDEYRRVPSDMHVGLLDAYIVEEVI